ncbi:MAG TPA: hypothetical protein VHU22_02585 [Xanthobacteraceae bacterium]|jgi:hypothetical protein|nr:hypothetical protein [Xanthobacteraceae bacterium]
MNWPAWVPQAFQESNKFFDGITLIALIGGALGAVKFLIEYIRDNRRKRLELYNKLRDEFRTNENFSPIFAFLEKYEASSSEEAKEKLGRTFTSAVTVDERSEFAAFLEDIAMTMKSGALKARVANYMFGYYAIICWENEPFWRGLRESKDDPYWALLKNFVWWMKFHRRILKAVPSLVVFSLKV